MTQTSPIQMLGVAIPTLRELRRAILSMSDADSAVKALREAGYAGGDAVHAAFEAMARRMLLVSQIPQPQIPATCH